MKKDDLESALSVQLTDDDVKKIRYECLMFYKDPAAWEDTDLSKLVLRNIGKTKHIEDLELQQRISQMKISDNDGAWLYDSDTEVQEEYYINFNQVPNVAEVVPYISEDVYRCIDYDDVNSIIQSGVSIESSLLRYVLEVTKNKTHCGESSKVHIGYFCHKVVALLKDAECVPDYSTLSWFHYTWEYYRNVLVSKMGSDYNDNIMYRSLNSQVFGYYENAGSYCVNWKLLKYMELASVLSWTTQCVMDLCRDVVCSKLADFLLDCGMFDEEDRKDLYRVIVECYRERNWYTDKTIGGIYSQTCNKALECVLDKEELLYDYRILSTAEQYTHDDYVENCLRMYEELLSVDTCDGIRIVESCMMTTPDVSSSSGVMRLIKSRRGLEDLDNAATILGAYLMHNEEIYRYDFDREITFMYDIFPRYIHSLQKDIPGYQIMSIRNIYDKVQSDADAIVTKRVVGNDTDVIEKSVDRSFRSLLKAASGDKKK